MFGDKQFVKQLFKLFVPAAMQSLIAIAVVYVDNFALATLVADPVQANNAKDALGLASPVINLVVLISIGWLGGTGIMISQYFGNKEVENVRKAVFFRVWTVLLLQMPFIIIMLLMPGELIAISGGVSTGQVWEYSQIYLFYTAFTYIPFAIAYALSYSLQETRRTTFSFIAALSGMAINIVLDPIAIIFSPNVETAIMWVALSTGGARIVQCLIVIGYIIYKNDTYLWFFKSWRIDWKHIKRILNSAFAIFLNDSVFSIANMMLVICLLTFNTKIHDATTNLILIIQFTSVIWPGMSAASSVLIGSELGAHNIPLAKQNADKLMLWGVSTSILLGLILLIVASFINPILSPSAEAPMIELSRNLEFVMAPIIMTQGIFSIAYYAIRAGGSKIVFAIDCSVMLVWLVLMCSITFTGAANDWNPLLFVLLLESNQIVRMILGLFVYKRGNWARSLTKNQIALLNNIDEQIPSAFVAG